MVKIELPKGADIIIKKLESRGYKAYVIGGGVRDSLLGITPQDWDICTNAFPNEVMAALYEFKIIETGLQHGTVTVMIDGVGYEVTTFRKDGEYKDNRHPDSVEFVDDLYEDMIRRDFTINSIAYNPKTGIIDYCNGITDLHNGVIRCNGNPNDRFKEDALRVLRAARFAIRYNFDIDKATLAAMEIRGVLLFNISIERINDELTKTLLTIDSKTKQELIITFLREFSMAYYLGDTGRFENIANQLKSAPRSIEARIAVLFDWDRKNLESTMFNMRFPNKIISDTVAISKYAHKIAEEGQWMNVSDNPSYYDKCIVRDIGYQLAIRSVGLAPTFQPEMTFPYVHHMSERIHRIGMNGCYKISKLKINGDDLKQLGFHGKEIGDALGTLLNMVMSEVVENKNEKLTKAAISIKSGKLFP